MKTNHSSGLLIAGKPSSVVGWPVVSNTGRLICDMPMVPVGFPNKEIIDAETEANAQRIAQTWNAHDELVKYSECSLARANWHNCNWRKVMRNNGYDGELLSDNTVPNAVDVWIRQLGQAALAKARGES